MPAMAPYTFVRFHQIPRNRAGKFPEAAMEKAQATINCQGELSYAEIIPISYSYRRDA